MTAGSTRMHELLYSTLQLSPYLNKLHLAVPTSTPTGCSLGIWDWRILPLKFRLFRERTLPLDNNNYCPVTSQYSPATPILHENPDQCSFLFFFVLHFLIIFHKRNRVSMHILIGQKHAWLSFSLLVNWYLHYWVVQWMQRKGKPWSLH